jgi:hypothetical protein
VLKDLFLRQLLSSLGAWLCLVFFLPAIWALSSLDSHVIVAVPLIIGSFLSALFAPWWILDAILLRPLLLQRLGWIRLAPIECLSLFAYRCLLQWHVIASGRGDAMIFRSLKEMIILYAGYLAFSMLLLDLLSRLANRKTSASAK